MQNSLVTQITIDITSKLKLVEFNFACNPAVNTTHNECTTTVSLLMPKAKDYVLLGKGTGGVLTILCYNLIFSSVIMYYHTPAEDFTN